MSTFVECIRGGAEVDLVPLRIASWETSENLVQYPLL